MIVRLNLDWTFILEDTVAEGRIFALLYLLRERYALNPSVAGISMRDRYGGATYCEHLMVEVRQFVAPGTTPRGPGSWCSAEDASHYLRELVAGYDTPAASLSFYWLKRLIRRYRTRRWRGL